MLRKWIEEEDFRMPEKRQGSTTDTSSSSVVVSTPSTSSTSTSTTSTSTSSTSSTISSTTSTTSTTTSTSTTSTLAVVTTPTSTSTSSSTTSSLAVSTLSNGGVITITQTLSVPSVTHTAAAGGSKSFFDNKAEVGAVFGVAGVIAMVLGFFLITTCIRRRRAQQFDKDVAEAAAAAAAANANPFFEDEEDAGNRGGNWDPRRTSAQYAGQGYGRINEDPYGYAAPGVIGAGAAAGFGRSNTNHYQGGNQRNAYNMNDLSFQGAPPSSYGGYGAGAGYYMNDLPPPPLNQDYGRPSFSSSTAPGVAGVGSGGGYVAPDQNLHYRGRTSSTTGNPEDAYGGYAVTASDSDPYGAGNQYSSGASLTHQNSTPYTSGTSKRFSAPSPPSPPTTVPPSRSPPISPTAPPSYSNHSGGHEQLEPPPRQQFRPPSFQRPLSGPPPNIPLPPTPGTPDEQGWEPSGRPLRVANE